MIEEENENMDEVIVVGSGPAGVSAAKGLLERGCKVTLLDVGCTIEFEKQLILNKIQSNNFVNDEDIASLRWYPNGKGKSKLPYGSNFIYKDVKDYFSWDSETCYLQSSFAQGGLSNVWGGALAEYSAKELIDWPISCRDLSRYYSKIIAWLGDYYTKCPEQVLSKQAVYLKNSWDEQSKALYANGFSYQIPALAVNFNKCCLCGSCQYGCPYGLIYNSSFHLALLRNDRRFIYINNIVLENFFEENQKVKLLVKNINDKQIHYLSTNRLFIACGAGLSSLLYLRSLNQVGKKLILKDSQHFILPCLMNKKLKEVTSENLHVLCQLKISLSHKMISPCPVHLQLYTYMDLYQYETKNKLKWVYPFIGPVLKRLLARFVVLQGYLDMNDSNQIQIQYHGTNQFTIGGEFCNPAHKTIKRIVYYLKKHHNNLAFKPLGFLLSQSQIGQSNHVTGSLPMSDVPKDTHTDIWGRPLNFERVHFVDGSILPRVPAGPITLTIMANAYRIAKECQL